MMFDQIEDLKREYSDKFVVVTGNRPELSRFAGATGQIKTVNMSGRALVEFNQWNNIGWYDIDLSYLTVVPAPAGAAPKEEKKKAPAAKATATPKPVAAKTEGKPSALEMARAQGAAKKPESAVPTKSVADVVASTSAGAPAPSSPAAPRKPGPPAAPSARPKMSAAEIIAAARANKPAEGSGEKLSTAEVLAAARAKKDPTVEPVHPSPGDVAQANEPVTEAAPIATTKTPEAPPAPEVKEVVVVEEPVVTKPAAPAKAAAPAGDLPKTTAERIAYCRRVDAKS